ncbi:uncharacterized protein LOC110987531 [Acanthaster planci]|uniref:Uncharacterized protein LOC110987531 n=1 Tax=Acanthaster planci TaxID=133434 RepID=A0A8B7ZRF3_ACAPL|nr:uncharacterized protein LOC110987531 [Acanthaster planci]
MNFSIVLVVVSQLLAGLAMVAEPMPLGNTEPKTTSLLGRLSSRMDKLKAIEGIGMIDSFVFGCRGADSDRIQELREAVLSLIQAVDCYDSAGSRSTLSEPPVASFSLPVDWFSSFESETPSFEDPSQEPGVSTAKPPSNSRLPQDI